MTTVATKDAVFIHTPKTGGTTVTLALAEMGLIEYDYRFQISRPKDHGLTYDHECRLMRDGKHIDAPHNSNPHASASQLRAEDKDKPRIQIIRQPHDWYSSFWAHHKHFNWGFTSGMPESLLKNGAAHDFQQWIHNILKSDPPGFCTRYFKMYGGHGCLLVRLEDLTEDWKRVAEPFGLAGAVEHMYVKKNTSRFQQRDSLKVSQPLLDRIKVLDREIYEQYQKVIPTVL